jgi:sugar transferase (PEP-CTERM system associated)
MHSAFRHYIPRSFLMLGAVEAALLLISIYFGVWLRFGTAIEADVSVEPVLPKALLFTAVMSLTMTSMGLYQRNLRQGTGGTLMRLGLSFVVGFVIMSLLFYAFPSMFIGRGAFGLGFALALFFVMGIRGVFYRLVDEDTLKRRVLVLGAGSRALPIAELRRKSDLHGIVVLGYVHISGEHDVVEESKVLHPDTSLVEFARENGVDEIVVAVEDRRKNFPVHELLDCKMSGIDVLDVLSFFERQMGKLRLDLLQPSWMIFGEGFRSGPVRAYTKRLFDVVISLIMLAITWPLMVLVTMAILIESMGKGPILYRQMRVGQNWQLFQVLKFRSMRVDAEKDGVAQWAERKDSRVTRVGKVIRKTRMDELPQLINVLRGDMSFVGPRPERPMFVEKLTEKIPYYAERHRIKPGITGWAQISYPYGSSEKDALEKLQFDLYYVKNYSLFLDLVILFQTAEVIFWGRGAH